MAISIPFFPAKFQTAGRGISTVWGICIHTMETPQTIGRAKQVALWFASKFATMQASAHFCIDATTVEQNVLTNNTAWATGDWLVNQGSISLELAGEASQTPAEWADLYAQYELANAAAVAANQCFTLGIPVRHLTPAQIRAIALRPQRSVKPSDGGLFGHWDVTLALNIKGGHVDPGKNFPWDAFLALVAADVAKLKNSQ